MMDNQSPSASPPSASGTTDNTTNNDELAQLRDLNAEQIEQLRLAQETQPLVSEPKLLSDTSNELYKQLAGHDAYTLQVQWIASPEGSSALSIGGGDTAGDGASTAPPVTAVRLVRRDGNCFLRAVIFGLCSSVVSVPFGPFGSISSSNATDEQEALANNFGNPVAAALMVAFQRIRTRMVDRFGIYVEDFLDVLGEVVTGLAKEWSDAGAASSAQEPPATAGETTAAAALKAATSPDTSEYLVVALRFIASLLLQEHAPVLSPFIPQDDPAVINAIASSADGDEEGLAAEIVRRYCNTSVEPVGCESDQTTITALCAALGCNIDVVALNAQRGEQGKPPDVSRYSAADVRALIDLNPDNYGPVLPAASVTLRQLFRPGHYDVLC